MKLKNTLLLVALTILLGTTFGNPIDVKTAKKVASTFYATVSNAKGADLDMVYQKQNEKNTATYFYVFSSSNGFVMVAGDDQAMPILGYSNENPFFTEVPAHAVALFDGYCKEIEHIVSHNVPASAEISQVWQSMISGTYQAVKGTNAVEPLLKNKWGQGSSKANTTGAQFTYNAKCPMYSKQRAVTGCMAMTISQIMHYWKYPTKGVGSYSYTSGKFGQVSANFANTTYDWANMPERLYVSSSQAQIDAVATLLFHAGVGCEMDYGLESDGGSAASLGETASDAHGGQYALKTYFGYPTARVIDRTAMGDAAFLSAIKAQLDKRQPVTLCGACDNQGNGGHIFVSDGYNAQNQLHINWGWESMGDGYFTLGSLNPKVSGDYKFNYYNQSMIDIVPMNKLTDATLVLNAKASTSLTSIPCGTAFTFTANIANKGPKTFNGQLRAFIATENMTVQTELETVTKSIAAGANVSVTFNSKGASGFMAGKQPILIEYKPTGSNEWLRVAGYGTAEMPYYATFTGDTKVSTKGPYNITSNSATIEAVITPGCANIASRGFEYKKTSDAYYKVTYETSNEMKKTITNLSPNTSYQIRVWINVGGVKQYTNPQTFTTRSTGIEDIVLGDVTIYPNPAKENLNIDLSNNSQKIERIELLNALGQNIYRIERPANTLYTIPTAQYSNGLYFIRMTSAEGVATKKVLISK